MNLYTIALFAHVIGAIGIFAGLSAWLFGVALLWRVGRVEQMLFLVVRAARCCWTAHALPCPARVLGVRAISLAI